ncbi:plasmid replication protein RepC [Brucella pituitosa]|uniref:plasmid replication protein RepC n=1 Tax=Brucella pituitosa TaxID=571256 RepID=UPI0009A23F90|nr:plasmid replication protein RepC [Brucella pituitosa]
MQNLDSSTSAFRRRMNSAAPSLDAARATGPSLKRWAIYKQLCVAKSDYGLNDRCLAVLSSLLSFLPTDELSRQSDPIVFPSNRQLALRAHGMPESTLRRHLSTLVAAGLITRKDSPTRKRYAHKDNEGGVQLAFGFSFAPLLERASDIAQAAARIVAATNALKRLRDEVSVVRRDLARQFQNELPDTTNHLFLRFRSVVDSIPRRASTSQLLEVKSDLKSIEDELAILLKNLDNATKSSGSAAQTERQHNESLAESLIRYHDSKWNDSISAQTTKPALQTKQARTIKHDALHLEDVVRYCPDISAYSANGITCWRDLLDATSVVSKFLGITETAYHKAILAMGREGASAVIAWILQRSSEIQSPGGYLHKLTQKFLQKEFAIARMLFGTQRLAGGMRNVG